MQRPHTDVLDAAGAHALAASLFLAGRSLPAPACGAPAGRRTPDADDGRAASSCSASTCCFSRTMSAGTVSYMVFSAHLDLISQLASIGRRASGVGRRASKGERLARDCIPARSAITGTRSDRHRSSRPACGRRRQHPLPMRHCSAPALGWPGRSSWRYCASSC
jgi:hypothetical protein